VQVEAALTAVETFRGEALGGVDPGRLAGPLSTLQQYLGLLPPARAAVSPPRPPPRTPATARAAEAEAEAEDGSNPSFLELEPEPEPEPASSARAPHVGDLVTATVAAGRWREASRRAGVSAESTSAMSAVAEAVEAAEAAAPPPVGSACAICELLLCVFACYSFHPPLLLLPPRLLCRGQQWPKVRFFIARRSST
jgi:hypothetical protein